MNGSQSFHTGDEVFEIPVVPAPLERNNKLGDLAQSADCSTYVYMDVTMSDVSDEGTRKKARDPHEPQKPVSAYALFFRDTQAAIKGQNPDASFEEVSKIVTSMWEALDPGHKNVYKKKAEAAKREYGRAITAYRANANSNENGSPSPEKTRTTSPRNITGKTTNPINNAKISPSQEMSENQQPKSPETSKDNANIGTPDPLRSQNEEQNKGSPDQTAGTSGETNTIQRCIREGCANVAIINADWEDEYCSNECVITHCRDVFAQWVQSNSVSTESYTS